MPFVSAPLPLLVSILPMLEAINDGLQIFDLEGNLVYVNTAGAQNFGYTTPEACLKGNQKERCELIAVTFQDELGRPLAAKQSPFARAVKGEATAPQTLTYVDRQRYDRGAKIQTFPIRDASGEVVYSMVISHDIGPARLAVRAIQQQTQQLHHVADAVPSLIAYVDCYEHHHYANSAYLKAYNLTANEIMGKSLQAVLGPVFHHQLQESLQQARQGQLVNVCLPIARPNQKVQYKQVTLIPQQEEHHVVGMYLVLNDITAHKRIADLLQTESNFFRHALEAARVGIWEWNCLKAEMIWSQPQEKLFGLIPGSFDGKPDSFWTLVDERDRPQLQTAIERALQSQQHFAAEFRITLPDRRTRWLSHRGEVLRDENGQALRMVGVTFDITGQKEAEERLLQQVKRDHLVAKISQEISRSEDLDEVLPKVVREVREHLNVDRLVIIDLRSKMAGKVAFEDHALGMEPMLTWEMRHPWAVKEAFLRKYREGYPVAVADVNDLSLSAAELGFLEFFQITADLTVPLLEDKRLWGLLSVHAKTPREWRPEDYRLLETLGTLVSTAIQRDRLHHNLTKANQKLKRYAYLDGLTQVANRRRFEQFIHHEWRRLMREKAPIALIMADIDFFKAYNDIYGHQAGDECLRRVAGTIRSAVQRPADMVARYGGEEFAVVLPNTDLEGAENVAQKIAAMVRGQKIPHKGAAATQIVTMSLGVAVMFPHPLKVPDNLIEAADLALYQAKEAGRNCIICYQPMASKSSN